MNIPNCPICTNYSKKLLNKKSEISDSPPYELWECEFCGVQFWTPFKNPGATWYEHDERYADRNANPILKPNKKHTDTIDFFKTPGRVLDVGCGVGNFLSYAKQKDWECVGIDFDRDAIEAGKQTFNLQNLFVSDLPKFAEGHKGERFNLVTFFDVFEHLDNHNEFISLVDGLVAESGYVALSVPYRHGWRWLMPHDLPPRHLTRWDEKSLSDFLNRAGFDVVLLRRLPASFYYLVMKIRFRYGKWASFGLVKKVSHKENLNKVENTYSVFENKSVRVWTLQMLAKAKDILFFGIPAGILWLLLLLTRKRYTDFYVIARRR